MTPAKPLSDAELKRALGGSYSLWCGLVALVSRTFPDVREEWKCAKVVTGRVCLLRQKERTLLYLVPVESGFEVCVVLGERAVSIVLSKGLGADVRQVVQSARKYVEGRSVRFKVVSEKHLLDIKRLVEAKLEGK